MEKTYKDKIPSIKEQLNDLASLEDSDIDLSDIPEIDFTNAERGRFYSPSSKD